MGKKTLKKCQQIVSFFHGSHRAEVALRDEIKKFFTGANLKSSVKHVGVRPGMFVKQYYV